MNQTGKISAGQLFTLAFLTRVIMMLTVDSRVAGGKNLQDLTLSALCYLGLNLVLILPAWFLHRRYPELDLLEISGYAFGKAGGLIALLYAAYFLFINGYFVSNFQLFMQNEINTQVPVWVISVALLVVAAYGAFLGLESIARTSGFVLILAACGMIFLLVALNQELRAENFTPLLYDGPGQTLQGTLLFLSRSSFYCVIPFLLPKTQGALKCRYLFWNVGLCLFFIVMIVTVCGTLGPVAGLQNFPVYTMAALAQSGPFQRLDAIYTGVWVMGLFLTTALDLYLISLCISFLWGKIAGRVAILAGAVLLVVGCNTFLASGEVVAAVFGIQTILPATMITGVLLPIIILLAVRHKDKTTQKKEVR